MKMILIFIIMLKLISFGMASSENITPDDIIAENANIINIKGTTYVSPASSQINATPDTTGNLTTINESNPIYWYNKGIALFKSKDYSESLYAYDEAVRLNQSYAEAWYQKGLIHHVVFNEKEKAIEAYDEAIKSDPNYALAWNGKGVALNDLKKFIDAIQSLNKAIEINQSFTEAWNSRAVSFERLGNYSEAIKNYDKSIELNPQFALAWKNKGLLLDDLGKHDEAIKAYDKAIEIDPLDTEIRNYKAHSLITLGKGDEANKAYDEIIEMDPLNWQLWNTKAGLQKEMGVEKTYFVKDFFTDIDGKGAIFFLSFVGKDTRESVTPEGKLLIILLKDGGAEVYSHAYDIKKNDYDSYVGGIALQKWISIEEMNNIRKTPSRFRGMFAFQDVKGVVSAAKEEW